MQQNVADRSHFWWCVVFLFLALCAVSFFVHLQDAQEQISCKATAGYLFHIKSAMQNRLKSHTNFGWQGLDKSAVCKCCLIFTLDGQVTEFKVKSKVSFCKKISHRSVSIRPDLFMPCSLLLLITFIPSFIVSQCLLLCSLLSVLPNKDPLSLMQSSPACAKWNTQYEGTKLNVEVMNQRKEFAKEEGKEKRTD